MRTDTGDDRLLINALRKLLPPYEGSDMVLYRSETRENRDHQTYGISWSAQPGLAKSMVKEDAPRVLLKANVPANAIMAEIRNDDDRYAENEFLVDRTALPENAVQVVRSPPKPFAA